MSNNNSRHYPCGSLGWRVFSLLFLKSHYYFSLICTHIMHSWMHPILVPAMQETLPPFPENEIFHSVPQVQCSRLRWRQPSKGCRSVTRGVQRTSIPENGSCWMFSHPPSNVLWQQLPQRVPARAPTDFPGCLLQEWGLSSKGRTTSHPRLDFVKRRNSISYAFSLLPLPVQLISHCDKCSLALNFSSESWLPKCVQKGKSKVMQ